MEQHLKRGLINWGGVEEALWDAIGKVANQFGSRCTLAGRQRKERAGPQR